MAKMAKSQFQYFFEYFWIFATVLDEMFRLLCVSFNRGHSFETLGSLMSWDGKTQKNPSPFDTTDGKSRTRFLRIYIESRNTYIVTIYYLA